MRRFHLQRTEDFTGVSGTGLVAEGVVFSTGRAALHWRVPNMPLSTVVYDSIEDVERVHGHEGRTQVVWVDK